MCSARKGVEPGSPAAARGRTCGCGDQRQHCGDGQQARPSRQNRAARHGPWPQPFARRPGFGGCVESSGRRFRVCEWVWARRRGEECGSGGSAAGPSECSRSISSPCDLGQAALVGVGQPGGKLREGHPGHLADFDVLVGELTAEEAQEVVVHGLVHAASLGDEPVVDAAQRGQHAALDAGLFCDLADRGLLGGLAELDVALGQRPQHPASAVHASDQRCHLTVLRAVDAVDHQTARRRLVHGAQPVRCAPRRRRACGRCRRAWRGRPSRRGLVWSAVGAGFVGWATASGGPAERRPRRLPRRRRGLARSPSDTQAIVAAT